MDSIKLIDNNNLIQTIGLPTQDMPTQALYIVGLPIGNLADISLRALWILNHVDMIAAEDTRETKKILEKFNISSPLCCVHQHNEQQGAHTLIEHLQLGKRIALVTDAGTPAVSDPGAKVVRLVQEQGFRVIPIPGASAVITAMSVAGMAPEGFIFHGFLSGGKQERRKTIKELEKTKRTFILYEAPHRIQKLITDLTESLEGSRRVVIARELTKKFESIEVQNTETLSTWIKSHKAQGEYVVIVNAQESKTQESIDDTTLEWISKLADIVPTSQLASLASEISSYPKKALYEQILSIKNHRSTTTLKD